MNAMEPAQAKCYENTRKRSHWSKIARCDGMAMA